MAASAGSIAAAPMIATITKSDGMRGRLDHRGAAGGDFDAGAGKAGLEFAVQAFHRRSRRGLGFNACACSISSFDIAAAPSAPRWERRRAP